MTRYSGSVRPFRPARGARQGKAVSRLRGRRRRLRWAGYTALLIGAIGAGFIYWDRVYHPTPTIEELLPASSRAHRRQMGILYGTVGSIAVDLEQTMRRPETQAVLVFAGCAAVAGACLLVARSSDDES
jgi:hypothetical protein